ncbi:MAG TPA: hypothetical protein VH394_31050 [Thermoanaerobaculia bacterium]|jgi:hypothetical protein|nr:hypothetical protein [Thermoanaerobaculia bacterium]
MLARIRGAVFGLLGWARDLFRVFSPTRYSVLTLVVVAVAFLAVPQGQDILRRMTEWEATTTADLLRALGTVSLFVVAVLIWAASTWYWARVILYLRQPGGGPDTDRQRALREWVPRILGFLAIVSMAAACWIASDNYRQYVSDDGTLMGRGPILRLRVLSLTLFALSLICLRLVTRRRQIMKAVRARRSGPEAAEEPVPAQAQFETVEALPRDTKRAVRVSLLLSLVLGLLFALAPVAVGPALGALPIVVLTAANGVMLGTGLLYLSRRWRLPLLVLLLIMAVIFSRWNDNHAMRLAEDEPGPAPLTIQEHFRQWQGSQTGKPIFVVAADGGGIRAAYWAALVLSRLEDRAPGFSRQVFAVSGVSGGSLGGAVFASLAAEKESGRVLPCGDLSTCSGKILGHDFLSPAVARMVAPDFVQRFLPVPLPLTDRAHALEDGWADAWEDEVGTGRFERPFQDLWSDGRAVTVPSLLLNGTHVESGRRIMTTNLRWTSGDLRDTYDLLRVVRSDLPLKTAIHNSARFAYVSPAGTMRPRGVSPWWPWGKDRGHVVDGGYFENSGTVSALELVNVLQEACGHTCDDRIYMIHLQNNPAMDPRQKPDPGNPDNTLDREDQPGDDGGKDLEPFTKSYPRLNELLSPVRALANTRNARGGLAVKVAQAALRSRFLELGLCERVADPARPGKTKRAPLPLGWQLSETSQYAMEDQLKQGFNDACPFSDNWKTMEAIAGMLGSRTE